MEVTAQIVQMRAILYHGIAWSIHTGQSRWATVIVAKALIDIETGRTIIDLAIFIRDGRVESVGSRQRIPASAKVIDLADKYLMPRLIDAHTHLCHEYRRELDAMSSVPQ